MREIAFLATDVGYSATKYGYPADGGLKTSKFPTAVAQFPASFTPKFGGRTGVSFQGRNFFIGEEALKHSHYVLPTQTEEFSVIYSPLLLYHAFNKEGVKPKAVCLSIAINEFGKEISFYDPFRGKTVRGKKEELLEEYASEFEVNGEKFSQEVVVLPQGLGIWFDQGQPEECVIVDIGRRTVDVVVVSGGQIEESLTKGYSDRGTITIVQLLRDYIAANYGLELSLQEAEEVLRTGRLRIRGKEEDLSQVVESLKEPYAMKTLVEVLNSPTIRPLWEKHGNVIVAGGGAYFIPEPVKKQYPITIPEDPEYSNVRGFAKHLQD